MTITGIIAEFNPLHNGHAFLLHEARRITHADLVLVVMSGNFVQRGAPALLSKYERTYAALRAGADLVIELPVYSAAASAEFFADGAIRLLTDLGADNFVFGCEVSDTVSSAELLEQLFSIAELLVEEPDEYKRHLKSALSEGMSFPLARSYALQSLIPETAYVLDTPNNLLGIEYLKACIRRNSPIKPYILARQGNAYHDISLPQTKGSQLFASACALRKNINEAGSVLSQLADYMPDFCFQILMNEYGRSFPITENDFSSLLSYRMLMPESGSLYHYADMNHALVSRIRSEKNALLSFSEWIEHLKTRDLTYTRVSRALTHLLLGITEGQQAEFRQSDHTPYARVLGMTSHAFPYLKKRHELPVPVLQRLSEAPKLLSPQANKLFSKDLAIAELYRRTACAKFHSSIPSEYERELIILE